MARSQYIGIIHIRKSVPVIKCAMHKTKEYLNERYNGENVIFETTLSNPANLFRLRLRGFLIIQKPKYVNVIPDAKYQIKALHSPAKIKKS